MNRTFANGFYGRPATPRAILILEAGQPLVQIGGQRQLSEDYFDYSKSCESKIPHCAFYDFNLCGGEPYAVWN